MTALRLWLRWLFNAYRENSVARIAALEARADRAERQIAELKGALSDVIGELNQIRNNQSAVPQTAETTNRVRRMGSWRATVAALEGRPIPNTPQPISIQRSA